MFDYDLWSDFALISTITPQTLELYITKNMPDHCVQMDLELERVWFNPNKKSGSQIRVIKYTEDIAHSYIMVSNIERIAKYRGIMKRDVVDELLIIQAGV